MVGVMLGCCTAQRAVQWSLLTHACLSQYLCMANYVTVQFACMAVFVGMEDQHIQHAHDLICIRLIVRAACS